MPSIMQGEAAIALSKPLRNSEGTLGFFLPVRILPTDLKHTSVNQQLHIDVIKCGRM